jgi:hypothetical protein
MLIEVVTDVVWTGDPLSMTVTVKLKVPEVVGLPEMVPLFAPRVSPAGSEELPASDQI